MVTECSTNTSIAEGDAPKRGPGRPRKVPLTTATPEPLFITRNMLAHLLNVSREFTYELERIDPDFPVAMTVGRQKRFLADSAERYAAAKMARATKERHAKVKQRNPKGKPPASKASAEAG